MIESASSPEHGAGAHRRGFRRSAWGRDGNTSFVISSAGPRFPSLGVHFTRMIHGGIRSGPNAVLAFSREGYRKSDINLADLCDALGFPGLWRFLSRHRRMCWEEMKRSFSRHLFCRSLQRLVPEIQVEDLEPGGSGVRAQAMSLDGNLVQDFAFISQPRALHVLNTPSPAAATAAMAMRLPAGLAEQF